MKIDELIEKLQEAKAAFGGDAEVKLAEITEGPNASDRYGISVGLTVDGKNFIGNEDGFFFLLDF
jgi:hypothetical protein